MVLTTVQSADQKIQRSPYHRITSSSALDTTVSAVLSRLLNRLARIHPMTPTSVRGGGSTPCGGSVLRCVDSHLLTREPDVSVVQIADQRPSQAHG